MKHDDMTGRSSPNTQRVNQQLSRDRAIRIGMVVLLLSGAASLGHQLTWTRRMTDLLGAGAQANARVVGCFFIGLAAGAVLTTLWLPRIRRPWQAAFVAELATALLACPILILPNLSVEIWRNFGPDRLGTWPVAVIRYVLSASAVVPPAIAVGASLPLVLTAINGKRGSSTVTEVTLYAIYTLGGAVGIAAVASIGLPVLGANQSMLLLITLNGIAALLCLVADRLDEFDRQELPCIPTPNHLTDKLSWPALWVAFGSGFGMLAFEVLAIELFNLTAPLAFFPQASVLFTMVVLIGISAFLADRLLHHRPGPQTILSSLLPATAIVIAATPLFFIYGIAERVTLGFSQSVAEFILQMFASACCALGLAVLIGGFIFPVTINLAATNQPRRFAVLLSINGLGALLGSEVAYRALLPAFGVHVACGILGLFYILLSLGWLLFRQKTRGLALLGTIASALGIVVLLRGPLLRLRVFIDAPQYKVLSVRSGREGVLAVVQRPEMGRGMIFNNQYLLGASAAKPDMEREAHIPLLLHPNPTRVLFLGLGTGITAGGSLKHSAVKSITAVEISELVADACSKYFSEYNGNLLHDPRVRVVVDDARVYCAAAHDDFDVIIGDLFTPWRPGEGRLCALEQFAAARAALKPGGVFCQWIPLHQLAPEQFALIVATFKRVFPKTYLFRNHLHIGSEPLGLIGFRDTDIDWSIIQKRVTAEVANGEIGDPLCRHAEGIAMLFLGLPGPSVRQRQPGDINTLTNLRLELWAAKDLILKQYDRFMVGGSDSWRDFVDSQLSILSNDLAAPAWVRPLPLTGNLFSSLELMARKPASQDYTNFSARVRTELPTSMLEDTAADWSYWNAGPDPRTLPTSAELNSKVAP